MIRKLRENKKYIIGILIVIGIIFCLINRQSDLSISVVTHPDSQIRFSTGQGVLEQFWQPQVRNLTGIAVPYTAEKDFSAEMKLELCTDAGEVLTTDILSQDFVTGESGTLEFSFDTQKVLPGERYRIRLSFLDTSADGELVIPSGSNYEGCTIDGEEQGEAAAFTMLFVKNSRLFWILLVFFPLISLSLFFYAVYGKKWEETVGLSLIVEALILYLFGLFSKLTLGMAVIYIVSGICLISAAGIMLHKRISLSGLFSKGILIYGILFILICINCRGAFFARWDEYSHWGLAVKDMFYYGSFAKHTDTTVILTRYMPFSTLAEYLFVYLNGLFSEEIVYVAYQTLLLSLGCVILGKIKKNGWKTITAVAVIVLVPVIFFGDVYNSIYADPLLAVLAGYILYCYLSEEMNGFNYLRIAAGILALVLSKDIGLAIAGLLVGVMVADTVYRQLKSKEINKKEYLIEISFLVLIAIAFFSWQSFLAAPVADSANGETAIVVTETAEISMPETKAPIKSVSSATISASGLSVSGIKELLKGEAPAYRYQSLKNFLIKMFDGDTFSFGKLQISYINFWIILLLILALSTLMKLYGKDMKHITFVAGAAAFGGIIYCLFLELLYLFAFSETEALLLSSHNRYLGSYACGMLMAILGVILAIDTEELERKSRVLSICLLAGVVMAAPMTSFVIKNMDYEITEDDVYYADDMEEVLRSFSKRGEKIFFVCNNTNGYSYYMFRNFACPLLADNVIYNFLGTEESLKEQNDRFAEAPDQKRGSTQVLPKEEWNTMLDSYQYVFILHPDPLFERDYGDLFEDPGTVDDGCFYRVEQDQNGNNLLVYIGKVGIKSYK